MFRPKITSGSEGLRMRVWTMQGLWFDPHPLKFVQTSDRNERKT